MHDHLLAYDETEAGSLLSAECLHFKIAGKSMEEGQTGADNGIESSSLECVWKAMGEGVKESFFQNSLPPKCTFSFLFMEGW